MFPAPDQASPDGVVAIGADLEPGTLLAAYRQGIFPMPLDDDIGLVVAGPSGDSAVRSVLSLDVAPKVDPTLRDHH